MAGPRPGFCSGCRDTATMRIVNHDQAEWYWGQNHATGLDHFMSEHESMHERRSTIGKRNLAIFAAAFMIAVWFTYSLPGWDGSARTSGCGLLKSTSGKPEGPYVDVQPNERIGDEIDASLFEDEDGTVYFLWHSGKIARMTKKCRSRT
jgi:hypothetical protein